MTADIINLRKARKARASTEKERKAAQNRAKFGRGNAERELSEAERALTARKLEALRREDDDGAA